MFPRTVVFLLATTLAALAAEPAHPSSPRLQKLEVAVAGGQTDALAAFWAEVKTRGTPLIEPIAGKPGHSLVTFLWHGTPATKAVTLFSGPQYLNHYPNQFSRLGDTDVWYLTVEMPDGLRVGYMLAETSAIPGATGAAAEQQSAGSDPLNLRRSEYDPTQAPSRTEPFSLFETPNAPPEPWLRHQAGVPHGHVESHEIASHALGATRKVTVYVPPGTKNDGQRLGCLYLFDGDSYLNDMHVVDVLDNLIAAGRIKPLIAVLISSAPGDARDRELQCDPKFTAFVCTELVPWVRSHYPVVTDRDRTLIGGYSLGGLEAAYALSQHPDLFGLLLVQSPSLQWEPKGATPDPTTPWMARLLTTAAKPPRRVYLSLGRDEPMITEKAQAFERILRAAGEDIRREEVEGQHDPLNWRLTFPRGLQYLLNGSE